MISIICRTSTFCRDHRRAKRRLLGALFSKDSTLQRLLQPLQNFAGNAKREEAFRKKGSTLIGDVHPEVAEVAGALTPVPGGVGPLTIAMLMFNTLKAAKMRRGQMAVVRG